MNNDKIREVYQKIIEVSNQFLIDCNYSSISLLENRDPNIEAIVKDLNMFSAILKKLASDNAENLAMSNRIEYYVMTMRNIALAISEKNEDALTEAIKLLDSLGVVDLHKHGC